MTEAEILERLEQVVRAQLRVDAPITPTTDLLRDLKLDSLDALTLLAELEDHFGVEFDELDLVHIRTASDLAGRLAKLLAE